MNKVEIITEELKKINIKYLGLSLDLRKTLLEAMEKYADQEIPPILRSHVNISTQRFNKRPGTNKTNTGLEMIVRERIEMIEKHGYTVDFDVKYNCNGELKQGAIACLTEQADFPPHWNKATYDHIRHNKTEIDRLAVAASFCIAEIDRILNK